MPFYGMGVELNGQNDVVLLQESEMMAGYWQEFDIRNIMF